MKKHFLKSKYKSKCRETGNIILVGDPLLFDPSTRTVYCKLSKAYAQEIKDQQTVKLNQSHIKKSNS